DQSRECDGLLERGALTATHCLRVAADLGVDSFAEAQTLVPQFVHIFRIELIDWRVHVADGLQKTQWEQRINGGEHSSRRIGEQPRYLVQRPSGNDPRRLEYTNAVCGRGGGGRRSSGRRAGMEARAIRRGRAGD